MKEILKHLASDCFWLITEHGFNLTGSAWYPGFGGQGWVEMSNSKMAMRLETDRDRIEMTFRASHSDGEWVSFDLAHHHLTGTPIDTTMVEAQTLALLRIHMSALEDWLASTDPKALAIRVDQLKTARAKRLFG